MTVSAGVNPTGLPVGTYTGSIQVQVAGFAQAAIVTVRLTITTDPAVASGGLTFLHQTGSPPPRPQLVPVTTPAGLSAGFTAAATPASWLAVSPASGTAPGYVLVSANPAGLASGTYTGTVTITVAGQPPVVVPAALTIRDGPVLTLSEASSSFHYQIGGSVPAVQSRSISIGSTGGALGYAGLPWTETGGDWLTISPATGPTPSQVTVTANATGLGPGTYRGVVSITAAQTGDVVHHPVTLIVSASHLLYPQPGALALSHDAGAPAPAAQTLRIASTGGAAPLSVTASAITGEGWLQVSPLAATAPQDLSVSIFPAGLAPGAYLGIVTVTAQAGAAANSPLRIPVVLRVTPAPSLTVQPAQLQFTQGQGGAAPAAQSLNIASSGSPFQYQIAAATTSGGNWLQLSPSSGTTPGQVTVSVNGGSLPQGTYNGTISVTAAGAANPAMAVPVTLTVGGSATLAATPSSLTFRAQPGGAAPRSQTIAVGSSARGAAFTVQTSAAWLTATPATGTTPRRVAIAADPTGLASGTHTGTVTISSPAAATPATVTVTLVVASGCTVIFGPVTALPAPGAYALTIVAATDCSWTAFTATPWLTLTQASGTGSGAVRFTAAPNPNASLRVGSIIVNSQAFNVTQDAGPGCSFALSVNSVRVPAEGATGAVPASAAAGCTFTVSSDVPWISVLTSGTGSAGYTVAPNTTRVERQGSITIAGQRFQVVQDGGTSPVRVLSVDPNNGGLITSRNLAFRFSEGSGASAIERTQMLIGSALDAGSGCLVYYDRASNSFSLLTDNGRQWMGPAPAGAPTGFANSRCGLSLSSSSASKAGNVLTVVISLTFLPPLAGPNNIWAEAGFSGQSTGYYQVGRYVVPQAPAPMAVTPAASSGTGETFRFTFNPGGPLTRAQVLLNSTLRAEAACLIYYDRPGSRLLLMNDAGAAYAESGELGRAGALGNSQCVVDLGRSGVSVSSNSVTLDLTIAFRGTFAGPRQIFAEMLPSGGNTSGYQQIGSFQVLSPPAQTPSFSVFPDRVPGLRFRFLFPADTAAPVRTQMLIGPALRADGGCLIYYDRAGNTFRLLNDAGTAWHGPAPLGSGGLLANSQCVVDPAGSWSSFGGNQLMVETAVVFTPFFAGTRRVFVEQLPAPQSPGGYVDLGSYVIP